MGVFFRIRRVQGQAEPCVRGYYIESTAPLNVEDPSPPFEPEPGLVDLLDPQTGEISPDAAVREIAGYLGEHDNAEVVVHVHGFNNPEGVVRNRFWQAYQAVNADPLICGRKNLVVIGYRWPSEPIFSTAGSFLGAAPGFVLGLAALAFLFLLLSMAVDHPLARVLLYLLGLLLAAVPFAAWLLRSLVYFRDSYRATQYGVPDLVEVIRQLDKALDTPRGARQNKRVRLSFIGHSMGAFVVTSLVRILTDVFERGTIANLDQGAIDTSVVGNIGEAFALGRLVLVSPDIPAETLMTRRANFLGPSLRRFEESYLFSNEADVVLRMISTLANSFSFPTGVRRFGFRLGNTEVLADGYGIVAPRPEGFLHTLRVGSRTLAQLNEELPQSKEKPTEDAASLPQPPPTLPERFTYFDCTDYVDADPGHPQRRARPYLSRAKRKAKLQWYNHWSLLLSYLLGRVDVHSGYFDGPFTQSLIFRLACLGWRETLAAPEFGGDPQRFARICREKQIQALVSPRLSDPPGPRSR